jgi:hypothetical protein
MTDLTARQLRLLREDSAEGRAFREGATVEAESRRDAVIVHCELIDYVRTLAEIHPEWTSLEIAESAVRVFTPQVTHVPP